MSLVTVAASPAVWVRPSSIILNTPPPAASSLPMPDKRYLDRAEAIFSRALPPGAPRTIAFSSGTRGGIIFTIAPPVSDEGKERQAVGKDEKRDELETASSLIGRQIVDRRVFRERHIINSTLYEQGIRARRKKFSTVVQESEVRIAKILRKKVGYPNHKSTDQLRSDILQLEMHRQDMLAREFIPVAEELFRLKNEFLGVLQRRSAEEGSPEHGAQPCSSISMPPPPPHPPTNSGKPSAVVSIGRTGTTVRAPLEEIHKRAVEAVAIARAAAGKENSGGIVNRPSLRPEPKLMDKLSKPAEVSAIDSLLTLSRV